MSVRPCPLTDEHGPHDWWEDAEQTWVCTGTMPDDWSGLIDPPAVSGPVACRSGHDDCTTDCGWCKGSGIDLARTAQAEREQDELDVRTPRCDHPASVACGECAYALAAVEHDSEPDLTDDDPDPISDCDSIASEDVNSYLSDLSPVDAETARIAGEMHDRLVSPGEEGYDDAFDTCPEPTCPLYGKAVMADHRHLREHVFDARGPQPGTTESEPSVSPFYCEHGVPISQIGLCQRCAEAGEAEIAQTQRAVPVERVRALVRLLFPEEMTPHAKRLIERVCEEYE